MRIGEYLRTKKILCDGAFGTWFSAVCGEDMLPEKANILLPETVEKIHMSYLGAGATLLRTNTFASNKRSLSCGEEELAENVAAAYRLAVSAAEKSGRKPGVDCFIAGDVGPVPLGEEDSYRVICDAFLEEGADILNFETFGCPDQILPVIREVKRKKPDLFILVQFCVNQHGYSNAGFSARRLLETARDVPQIDAAGFNCGVGPGHMLHILSGLNLNIGKYITALPNAGYPGFGQGRVVFRENADYFSARLKELSALGVDILGGCCGTTPAYLDKAAREVETERGEERSLRVEVRERVRAELPGRGFYSAKEEEKPLIAVELSPPPGADDGKVLAAAGRLEGMGIDVVTFPDSPSGRTRTDPVLMAVKVAKGSNLCVMPHLCCRDRNAIAIRSQLLGAYINGVRNLLVVTGDPVPTLMRREVKGVFNFDSVGLMNILKELNEEEFAEEPMAYGGAINQSRPNLEMELGRTVRKKEAGASFFLTQPVFTAEDAERVREIKQKAGVRILCGIMPLVSRKNALFMKNEMAGIGVTDELVSRFDPLMSREEGEAVGVELAARMMRETEDFADGYYFSLPFNRVYLLEKILKK